MFAYLQSAAWDVTSFFTSVWRYFVGRPAQASENLSESLLPQDNTTSTRHIVSSVQEGLIEGDNPMPAEKKSPLSQTTPLPLALRPAPVEEQKTLKPLSLWDYCKSEDEPMHDWLKLFENK